MWKLIVVYFKHIVEFKALQHWAFVKSRAHTQFVNAWISDSSMKTVWALPLLMEVQCDTALGMQQCAFEICDGWNVQTMFWFLLLCLQVCVLIDYAQGWYNVHVCTSLLPIRFSIPLYLCYYIANHCWLIQLFITAMEVISKVVVILVYHNYKWALET